MFVLNRAISHTLRRAAPKAISANFLSVNTTAIRAFTTTKPKRAIFDLAKPKHFCTPLAADATLPPLGDTIGLLDSNENWELCYDGLIGKAVTHVKQFSIFSMSMAFISAPVMLFFESSNVGDTGKAIMAATTLFFGVGSTLLLNIVCAPYVVRAFVSRTNPHILELTTVNFFGRHQAFRMHVNDSTSTNTTRPMATFQYVPKNTHFFLLEDNAVHPVFAPILPHLFEEVDDSARTK